jgi:ectoine hydroxylase-related dioxygenase (phytanoyl-CoA dioxygenase family)
MRVLDPDKRLISDLWLDQPDAHDQIAARVAAGHLTDADAEQLRHFVDQGFCRLSLGLDDAFFRAFDARIDELWAHKPVDLAGAGKSGDRVSFRDLDDANRRTGYRIADLHSHSAEALRLYLDDQLFTVVERIFDQPAVAMQSLYFQFGSEQALHRDPMFVGTDPPSHLMASWIALEDITPDSGPLLYAPGSHRMPWFEFEEGSVTAADAKDAADKRAAWSAYRTRMIEEMGLEVQPFTCQRGDVFLWHGGLLHGGQAVADPDSTRKSYVTQYSTAATYRSRHAQMKVRGRDGSWRTVGATTDHLLDVDGRRGVDNPLRHLGLRTRLRLKLGR